MQVIRVLSGLMLVMILLLSTHSTKQHEYCRACHICKPSDMTQGRLYIRAEPILLIVVIQDMKPHDAVVHADLARLPIRVELKVFT